MAEFVRPELESRGYRVFEISTVSHEGLRQLGFAMAEIVEAARDALAADAAPERIVIRPKGASTSEFKIRVEEGTYGAVFRVLGDKPVRWVKQTDFTNDEAIGYLADRLAKLGVENELFKPGAKPGVTVVIGEDDGVVFDWEPTVTGRRTARPRPAARTSASPTSARRTTRRAPRAQQERKDAKAAARAELEAERLAAADDGGGRRRWTRDDAREPQRSAPRSRASS